MILFRPCYGKPRPLAGFFLSHQFADCRIGMAQVNLFLLEFHSRYGAAAILRD